MVAKETDGTPRRNYQLKFKGHFLSILSENIRPLKIHNKRPLANYYKITLQFNMDMVQFSMEME